MSGPNSEMPILYALSKSGELVYVDDVPNGIACGCVCPSEACGQPLVAKNGGTKVIHHFAHLRGGCEWAIDALVVRLIADIIRKNGRMAFPAVSYWDAYARQQVSISEAQVFPIVSVTLKNLSDRGAPELVVLVGKTRKIVVLVPFTRSVKGAQIDMIVAAGYADIMVFDLRAAMRADKRLLDKHFDRQKLLADYQDPRRLESIVLDASWPHAYWERNLRAVPLEKEAREREAKRAEEERKRKEAERAERERLRKQREEMFGANPTWRRGGSSLRSEPWEEEAASQADEYAVSEEDLAGLEAMMKRMEAKRELRKALSKKKRDKAQREQAEREQAKHERDEERAREEAELSRRERIESEEGLEEMRAQIEPRIDQQDEIVRDELGRRWCKCEQCGKVAPEDEFSSMGGKGRLNLGTCRACMFGTSR